MFLFTAVIMLMYDVEIVQNEVVFSAQRTMHAAD
jgi:hypothetical protein